MSNAAPCEYLQWDSDFFGVRVGCVLMEAPRTEGDYASIEAWANANRIDCLYLLQDSDDVEGIIRAEEHGFRFMDVRVTYECGRLSVRPEEAPASPAVIRPLRQSDVQTLVEIASRSHHQTRFYADPRFSRERCDEMYRLWVRRSCAGWANHVVVAELDGQACGYMTIHIDGPQLGRVGLVAVDPASRNQGVGNLIVHASLHWLAAQGVTRATWPTSVRNVSAQRLCTKWGFALVSAATWHHCWRQRSDGVQSDGKVVTLSSASTAE